jgi:hypothetical protein
VNADVKCMFLNVSSASLMKSFTAFSFPQNCVDIQVAHMTIDSCVVAFEHGFGREISASGLSDNRARSEGRL